MRWPSLLLFLIGAWAWVPSGVFAQDLGEGRVRLALEATDRRIAQAATAISTEAGRARSELDMAYDLQTRARSAFAAGSHANAGRLTLEARRHADRAIALVRGLPDPDRVQAQLERTREMLERTRDRLQECDNDRARAMVQVAFDMQGRAENAAQASRYLGALQLTMGARERGLRALRLCRLEEDVRDSADRALRRTDQVIAQARDRLRTRGVPEAAHDALSRAVGVQEDAYRQFRGERYDASLQLTLNARSLAHRAARLGARAF